MASPTRRGRSVCLTLEFEAVEILKRLCESGRSHGKVVSLLLRAEEARRIEARRLREKLYTTVEEVLTAP